MEIAEYLARDWSPDREFLDGRLAIRNLGEFSHANLVSAICGFLGSQQRQSNVRVLLSLRIRISNTRIRVCDIAVLSREARKEDIPSDPPLVCIEVLSDRDTFGEVRQRTADYIAMGVQNIWLFDPERREAWICTNDAMTKVTGDVLAAAGTEIAIPLAEIWADLD